MQFETRVNELHGARAGTLGRNVIEKLTKCYAAKLHLNKGYSIVNPTRKPNSGYAPTFEQVTTFEKRMRRASRWPDLLGNDRADKPWMNGLPRLIFVSDMGDALTRVGDFGFLHHEIEEMQTEAGLQHLWLWLTKRPETIKRFSASIGKFQTNICAMTSITSNERLRRIDDLRETDAHVRGLSIEPLLSRLSDSLDLSGIDWVIVGGESGAKKNTDAFCVEWVEELRELCEDQGVAFFCKQLGRQPTRNGAEIMLDDKHGGDWEEWDDSLRVREFPTYFHAYRQEEVRAVTP